MHYEQNYVLLIELQKLDNRIDTVRDTLKELPARIKDTEEEIAAFSEEMRELDDTLKHKELVLREKNSEYEAEEEKLRLYKQQLMKIKNNDEYRAMLNQIDAQKEKITKIENGILEIEEELEIFRKELPNKKSDIESNILLKEKYKKELEIHNEVLREKINELLQKRGMIEEKIKVSVLKKYERLREKGYRKVLIPIIRIKGDDGEAFVCSACNSTIPLEISLKVKEGQAFLRCENCGRFLFYEEQTEEEK